MWNIQPLYIFKKMLCLYPAIRIVYILLFHPKQRIILTSILETAKCNHFMLVKIIQNIRHGLYRNFIFKFKDFSRKFKDNLLFFKDSFGTKYELSLTKRVSDNTLTWNWYNTGCIFLFLTINWHYNQCIISF